MFPNLPEDTGSAKQHRMVIYLPSRRSDGSAIEGFAGLAESTARTLCSKFGGVTCYPGTGFFRTEDGEVQKETIEAMEFYFGKREWELEKAFLEALPGQLGRKLCQESIACSLDGILILVPPAGDSPDFSSRPGVDPAEDC